MSTPFWYNLALKLLKPIYRYKIKKRAIDDIAYQQECCERFGPFQQAKNKNVIWFHAVSVGETNAAQPLIDYFLKQGHAVLVTNTTKTGQARAKSLFLKQPYIDLFQAVYLPVDQIELLKRFFDLYQPRLLALVETELWPNLIDQAHDYKIPTLLLNARLSAKSAQGYARVAGMTKIMLNQLRYLLAQDTQTQERFISLGLDKNKSQVVGNIKFDITAPTSILEQAQQLKNEWQLEHRKIIILASTHAPEEQIILERLAEKLKQDPCWLCIVVPRHPERFNEVFELCQKLELTTQRRSLKEKISHHTQVYLADTMGELWLWYALSQVGFVGGSLNEPGGGHNILEPIALNVATIIGPRYFNFQTIVDDFAQANAICIAQNAQEVVDAFFKYQDHDAAQQLTHDAQNVLAKNQGSLQKHIDIMNQFLSTE